MIIDGMSHSYIRPKSGLEKDIMKVLLYFDVFRFPLTLSEIYRFLPSNSITPAHVLAALHAPSLRRKVQSKDDYFFLASAEGHCAEERRENEQRGARLMRIARVVARIIRMFPYVRAVFLSGELSKGIASRKSDIDFVIVTKEGRLWIARTLLILFKKVFLLNRKRYFCVNQFITEDHLQVESRNIYTATEVATLIPLDNNALYSRYMQANHWITEYFPNWRIAEPDFRSGRDGMNRVRNVLERIVSEAVADRLNRWLMFQWQQIWNSRYPDLDDEERNRQYKCTEFISTAYGEDYQEKIIRAFRMRLSSHDSD